ncbi:MAG TPA: type II secretion system protein [Polyangiaceae bacterium]|nr:type II secretion system protein [Polyangiaceae bacterium]
MRERPTAASRRGPRAFTLLEVMVAVAILGMGLVVILTAQTGLFSSSKRAARLSQAVGLARCKMSEVEEQLLRKGYELTQDDEEGPCCEDETIRDLHCKWSISPISLPELAMQGGADAGTGMSSDMGTTSGSGGSSGTGSGDGLSGLLDTLGSAKDKLSSGNTQDALSQVSSMMSSMPVGAGPSMGAGALAPLAMGIVYPQLKGMLEASIRKVTVQVIWLEGSIERNISVTQYLTNPQQGGLMAVDDSGNPVNGAGGAPGTSTTGMTSSGKGTAVPTTTGLIR